MNTLDTLDAMSQRTDIPSFRAGDTVKVHARVVEGNRSRVQIFQGVVIRRQGSGLRETFTVRKVSSGVGVERTYPVNSPAIDRIEIATRGDVRRAKLFDRCEPKGGIEPFDRLVDQVMTQQPYASARRVFWIVDNGSSHRGQRSIERLEGRYPNLTLVHLPVHASWLNQIEIYFSIVQRKLLQPNDFSDLTAAEERLLAFGRHYEQVAQPFEWKFTRDDLDRLLERLDMPSRTTTLAA